MRGQLNWLRSTSRLVSWKDKQRLFRMLVKVHTALSTKQQLNTNNRSPHKRNKKLKHLHQLTNTQICQWIHKIHNKEVTATIKEDGSAVTVGCDSDGRRYVSREGKVGVATERFYDKESISLEHPGVNAALYIAAELWIDRGHRWVVGEKVGDAWNCEVVSNGLNVIEYKHTSLVMLHPIENSVTRQLSTPLNRMGFSKGMGVEIEVPVWSVDEYEQIALTMDKRHASVRFVWNAELPDVSHIVEFLSRTRGSYDGKKEYTAAEILERKASAVPVADREAFTTLRDAFATKLKMAVKYLESDPKLTREGIVLSDGENMVKVVNHLFVQANQYQHAVRNCIRKRTFSNDFASYFPTCPVSLISDIHKAWAVQNDEERYPTHVETHMLRVMLYTMRDHFIRAQHMKKLADPTGLYDNRYPEHAFNATMVAFKSSIDSLDSNWGKYS